MFAFKNILSTLALAAALAGVQTVGAQTTTGGLKILAPGGDNLWWLVGSDNNLIWTCGESTFPTFTVSLANANISLLTATTAIIAIEQNYNCAQTIIASLQSAPIGDGYTVQLGNPLNATQIYAESAPFSIKAVSAGYPPASATPVDTNSATVSKGTASNSINAPTGSGSGSAPAKTGAALSLRTGMGAVTAAGLLVAGFFTL
ncbi:hypothetical protein C8F04DRAFT_1079286 [Mycena alexandri]|uniref:Uncharacterized protein n=1 Tax=Mycena alexandri TaxID=1745969 RepID=A0AAD6XB56_9AGAR|nr:hypothetical protein C8F04DRAFT_1079286 [Mycena alexandri]